MNFVGLQGHPGTQRRIRKLISCGTQRNVDVSKVIATINDMVTLLKAEQSEDDSKKAYGIKRFDETDDEASDPAHEDAIENYKDQLSNTDARIEAVQNSTDKSRQQRVKVATSGRSCNANIDFSGVGLTTECNGSAEGCVGDNARLSLHARCTRLPRQHENVYDAPPRKHRTRTELGLWWLITLDDFNTPEGPSPKVHWCRYDGRPWVARPHAQSQNVPTANVHAWRGVRSALQH